MKKFPDWFQNMLDNLPDVYPEDKLLPLDSNGEVLGELDQNLKQIFNLIYVIQTSSEQMLLDHTNKHQKGMNLESDCCEINLLKINFFSGILNLLAGYFQHCIYVKYPEYPNIIICRGWKIVAVEKDQFTKISEEANHHIDQITSLFNSIAMEKLSNVPIDASFPFIPPDTNHSDLN